jgi:hypothetical protein
LESIPGITISAATAACAGNWYYFCIFLQYQPTNHYFCTKSF